MSEVELVLALLVAVAALAVVAARLRVPYPIMLVLGGCGLGFIPGLPPIQIDPAAVFLIFVPPLVYAAAFFTSWRDFVANIRPISSLAIGLVMASTLATATVARVTLGIDWAPALVLGAVVSNTDTTAVVAIAQQVGLPRRVVTILEGESLINDAMSLTLFRVAVLATVAGTFSPWFAAGELMLAVAGAVPAGWLIGWLSAEGRRRSADPRISIILSVLTPYAAYLLADQFGASGILATVVAGLYVGRREPIIEDAETRLQARAAWDVFIFGLNGLLFILVGVQLRPIWEALQGYAIADLATAAVLTSSIVILVRIGWVALMSAIPRLMTPGRGAGGERLHWQDVVVLAWAGLRGGDTLAAALAVPFFVSSGAPFPAREEIIFLAFTVIVATLVGQGLTLPPLIRWLNVGEDDSEEQEVQLARQAASQAALARLDALARQDHVADEVIDALRRRFTLLPKVKGREDSPSPIRPPEGARRAALLRETLSAQRQEVLRLRDEGAISDQAMRVVLRDLDLDEARLPHD